MTTGLTISDIREALAEQIRRNVSRDITVRAYPPAASGPSILVRASGDFVDYWLTFGAAGLSTVRLEIEIDPGGSDIESAARRTDDFLSVGSGNDSSVIDAVMADRTLGLTGVNAHVPSASNDEERGAVVSVEIHIDKVDANV